MKKIAVFTGTRAEYGLMRTLIKLIDKDKYFKLFLLISSTHLDKKFGSTINEIENDGIKEKHIIPVRVNTVKKSDMAKHVSEIIKLVSEKLEELKPDYLIVLGDRFETLGATLSAHLLGIKIIHIHGGETSLGALDDKLRHSISQLSTIHFTSAEIHQKKVIQMIGVNKNIFNIGPMVIDGLLNMNLVSKEEFEKKTNYSFAKRNFLITYHPETLSKDLGISSFENLLDVLNNYECNLLFTSPNSDVGSNLILERILNYIKIKNNRCFYIPSLGQELYLNALRLFDCVIGNSSSGITEAPIMKRKVLNVGIRQKGRHRFGSVIEVSGDYDSINKTMSKIFQNKNFCEFDLENFKKINITKSPSKQIIKILKSINP